MLRTFRARWVYLGLLCSLTCGILVNGLIEIVEEQHCYDQEFRLTCRELETHIAVLEAWYTSTEDLLQNITYGAENFTQNGIKNDNDNGLNQVYVYSSPKHNGYYELVNRTLEITTQSGFNLSVNDSLDSENETLEMGVGFVNSSEGCGVKGFLKNYASWKEGARRTPIVVRDTSVNLRAPVSYRCTGVNHCSFILEEDFPPSTEWAPGIVYIKYACFDDSLSVHFCNREIAVAHTGSQSEGYIRTPGYPHFYVGDDECRWKLKVHPEQRLRITLLDVSLRSIGPFEAECTDYITVIDEAGRTLLSSCEQVDVPHSLVSGSRELVVVVRARSEGAFPKRGVLLHYKSINCVTIPAPSNGYLVHRNEKLAHYVCDEKHVFTDSLKRARVIWCYGDNRWNDTVPSCIEERAVVTAESDLGIKSTEENAKLPPNQANMIVDIVIPSLLIAALFIGNAFIVLIIYKYRKRKTEDIEDEFNTIPLSVNGNAGNAV